MMIEDEIEKRHLIPERLSGRTLYEGHPLYDLHALVTLVRSLRAELARSEDRRSSRAEW